jgi:H+/gluconate symporter-like permease
LDGKRSKRGNYKEKRIKIKLKTMHILIGILIVAFIVGLVTRDKGDNFLDTLGSGCGTIIAIVVILGIIVFIASR